MDDTASVRVIREAGASMTKKTMKVGELFSRLFPERQIYHRSGGTVRYFIISPSQQAVLSVAIAAVVGWTLYATASLVFLPGSTLSAQGQQQIDKYERWVQELRARDALSRSQLVERTEAFQEATVSFEERHRTLEVMLDALRNGGELETAALRGDGTALLVNASIDEADRRQSRASESIQEARTDNAGVRRQIADIQREQQVFLDEVEDIGTTYVAQDSSIVVLEAAP